MLVQKTEDYGGVEVIPFVYSHGVYAYSHSAILDGDAFEAIIEDLNHATPQKIFPQRHLVVLHVHGNLYIGYKSFPDSTHFRRNVQGDIYMYRGRLNGTWRDITDSIYKGIWIAYGFNLYFWDIAVKADFMEEVEIAKDFHFYYLRMGVFITHIMDGKQEIWSLRKGEEKKFLSSFIMKQNDITYMTISDKNNQYEIDSVLVKNNDQWFTLPSELSERVKSFFKYIPTVSNPYADLSKPYQFKIPKDLEDDIKGQSNNGINYSNIEVAKMDEKMKPACNRYDCTLDLTALTNCESYTFTKTELPYEDEYVITTKMPFVFSEVVEGDNVVFDHNKYKPFLIVYSRYSIVPHVVHAYSYNGHVHYQRFSRESEGWRFFERSAEFSRTHPATLDIGKDVDERLFLKTSKTSTMKDVEYKCNRYVSVKEIHNNGRVIWIFMEPSVNPIYVTSFGNIKHINFVDTFSDSDHPISMEMFNTANNEYFYRAECDSNWIPLEGSNFTRFGKKTVVKEPKPKGLETGCRVPDCLR
ncbi:hypothetical protein BdWA1_002157 [Babesia duncani]|uniref:Uncharacterized protein n=1 Tax=Babesia duncani TaxID=323732 RepID=A0AAD9PM17_9APIC|nr:hypothetical protein BdWA1_002156 [Babesia duncani]KAK2196908.1 hypothetical protein BdWA1_002157 [Babesia duncani]